MPYQYCAQPILLGSEGSGDCETIARFSSDEGFAAVMSSFMMNVFDLQPISSRKNNDVGGSTVVVPPVFSTTANEDLRSVFASHR